MKRKLARLLAALMTAALLTACGGESGASVPEEITFPYAVPETPLVIESVVSYDGRYLEDGSDIEMAGVSALLLKNTGRQCVDYAKLQLTGSSTVQTFVASGLEAGATVLVQEAGKGPAVSQEYEQITADVALTERFELSEELLAVEETEDGTLLVTNLSEEELPCVRIFYKFYREDQKTYVGGITYMTKVEALAAGSSEELHPSHYVSGQSRIIMAKVYSTAEEGVAP